MKILSIRPDQAEMLKSLIIPEIIEAIKKKLPVTALVAVENGKAVGAIGGAADGSVFRLMSIFVSREYRNQGIGKALISKLERIVEPTGLMIRAEYTREHSDHYTLQKFFSQCGYREDLRPIPGYYIGYVSNLVEPRKQALLPELCSILPFSEIPDKYFEKAEKMASDAEAPIPEGGLLSEKVSRELSYAIVYQKEIKAYIAISQQDEELLTVEALYSEVKDPRIMMSMVGEAAKKMKETHKPDAKIAMLILNKESDKVMRLTLKDAAASSFTFIK